MLYHSYCRALVNVLIFPRGLDTLKLILSSLSLDPNSPAVPVFVNHWGSQKKVLEATWLYQEVSQGWGVRPVVEYPAGTENMDSKPLPSAGQLAEEMFALLRAAREQIVWQPKDICFWLAEVEEQPSDWDEDTQGTFHPQYSKLNMERCQPKPPLVLWHVYPGIAQRSHQAEQEAASKGMLGHMGSVDDDDGPGKRKYSINNTTYNWILTSERVQGDLSSDLGLARRQAVSASLTANSWRGVGTLYKKVLMCRTQLNRALTFPWSDTEAMDFLAWLSTSGISHNSIKSLANRISTLHQVLGWEFKRPFLLSRCLTGLGNAAVLQDQSKRKKLAMTPSLLLELRSGMKGQSWPVKLKRVAWMAFVWMGQGCLRVCELLPQSKDSYMAEQTPLMKDITMITKEVEGETFRILMLRLRCSKTNTRAVEIELVENKSTKALCPVMAFLKAKKFLPRSPEAPIFSLSSSVYLSPDVTNRIMRCCITSVDWQSSFLVNHSLRW